MPCELLRRPLPALPARPPAGRRIEEVRLGPARPRRARPESWWAEGGGTARPPPAGVQPPGPASQSHSVRAPTPPPQVSAPPTRTLPGWGPGRLLQRAREPCAPTDPARAQNPRAALASACPPVRVPCDPGPCPGRPRAWAWVAFTQGARTTAPGAWRARGDPRLTALLPLAAPGPQPAGRLGSVWGPRQGTPQLRAARVGGRQCKRQK